METETNHILFVHAPAADVIPLPGLLRDNAQLKFEYRQARAVTDLELALNERRWNLIVCDFVLPGLPPADVVRSVQTTLPQTPLILVYDVASVQEAVEMMRLGARGFVARQDHHRFMDMVRQELASADPQQKSANPPGKNDAQKDGEIARLETIVQDLQTQRSRLEDILAMMQDTIMSLTLPDHRLIFASTSFESVFGYPIQRFRDDPNFFRKIVHPDDLERASRAMQTCLQEGFAELDHRVIWPDGQVRWLHRRAWVEFDENGRPLCVNDTTHDITPRKEMEQALQEAHDLLEQRVIERTTELEQVKDRLEAIFNHSGDGLLLLDMNQGIQQANYVFDTLFGVAPGSYLGQPLTVFFQPDDAANIAAIVQNVARTHRLHHVEAQVTRSDGRRFDVEVSIAPVNRVDTAVTNLVCTIRDVTERKQVEIALRESEARYRLLAENVLDVILKLSPDMTITFVTPSSYGRIGYMPDELIGQPGFSLVHPDDMADSSRSVIEAVQSGATAFMVVERIKHKAGHYIWVEMTNTIIRDPATGAVTEFISLGHDITERKQAEQALQQALIQEKELGELKSRFVSMASHEFRNPMAIILATVETLLAYRQKLTEEQLDERLARIRQQVYSLRDMIDDVLQLSRIESGRSEFKPVEADLNRLCQSIIHDQMGLSDMTHIIHYQCDSAPVWLQFDTRLMHQVITHFLSNALKYSQPGTNVYVNLTMKETEAILCVRDEGIGIPPADMKHLFEPFHRAANVGRITGTGLGLSITHQLIRKHGGHIEVRSEVGVGSTFCIHLPTIQRGSYE